MTCPRCQGTATTVIDRGKGRAAGERRQRVCAACGRRWFARRGRPRSDGRVVGLTRCRCGALLWARDAGDHDCAAVAVTGAGAGRLAERVLRGLDVGAMTETPVTGRRQWGARG